MSRMCFGDMWQQPPIMSQPTNFQSAHALRFKHQNAIMDGSSLNLVRCSSCERSLGVPSHRLPTESHSSPLHGNTKLVGRFKGKRAEHGLETDHKHHDFFLTTTC